jgi:hypothetical protein
VIRTLAFAAAVAVALPAKAELQSGPGGMPGGMLYYEAMSKAPAGAWCEYTLSMPGRTDPVKVKYVLVERTTAQMAVEVETQTPMGPVVMHMEFGADGPGVFMLKRGRMQLGAEAVREMPKQSGPTPMVKRTSDHGKLVGTETVTTPAGSFSCKHYQQATERGVVDTWFSDKAMPAGIVKSVDPRGAQIILSAMGSRAAAKIR